jgi:hypothetical protein
MDDPVIGLFHYADRRLHMKRWLDTWQRLYTG